MGNRHRIRFSLSDRVLLGNKILVLAKKNATMWWRYFDLSLAKYNHSLAILL